MPNYELKARIDAVANAEGEGTELVTLSIPAGKDLQSVRTRIAQEHAEAENIKSDKTRTRVREALNRVQRVLQRYPETPENGLVVYAGVIDGDMTEFVFDDLPSPVIDSYYTCSNEFVLDPVEYLLAPDNTYGLLVIERGGAALGELRGDTVIPLRTMDSMVMGKTRAGGQSAQRFARERERQKQEFFKRAAESANTVFIDRDSAENNDWTAVDGLLIGGTTITVDDFLDGEYLDYRLRERLLGTYSVDHAFEQGLEQLADQASADVLDAERQHARDSLDRFFTQLSNGDGQVAYGENNVDTALQYGAVETLLVAEALSLERIETLKQAAAEQGGETVIISSDFARGEQFQQAFGGVAALLRFPIT